MLSSWRHPVERYRREPIGTNGAQQLGIEQGISFKSPVEIVAKVVRSGDFIDELEHDAVAGPM